MWFCPWVCCFGAAVSDTTTDCVSGHPKPYSASTANPAPPLPSPAPCGFCPQLSMPVSRTASPCLCPHQSPSLPACLSWHLALVLSEVKNPFLGSDVSFLLCFRFCTVRCCRRKNTNCLLAGFHKSWAAIENRFLCSHPIIQSHGGEQSHLRLTEPRGDAWLFLQDLQTYHPDPTSLSCIAPCSKVSKKSKTRGKKVSGFHQ